MVTGPLRGSGRPRSDAFEPEVRKPCLLLDGATTYAPGKGEWRRSATSGSSSKICIGNCLTTRKPIFRTPSIFCIGDRGRLYFSFYPFHRLSVVRRSPFHLF